MRRRSRLSLLWPIASLIVALSIVYLRTTLRASGTAGPYSDWDYVVEGANILCRDAGAALATSVSVAEATGVGREE